MKAIRLRTLCVLVASVGALAWAARMLHLSSSYRERAAWHAEQERWWSRDGDAKADPDAGETHDNMAIASHHSGLRRKYERAASRPWMPVGGDSP